MYTPYKISVSQDAVLFSERFHRLYHWLGLFGSLYARNPGSCVSREAYFREIRCWDSFDEQMLSLLITHHLLMECEGGFLLNESLFFGMTLWDLLLICEPWLSRPTCGSSGGGGSPADEYEALREFGRCQNLSRSYLIGIEGCGSS